MVAELDMERALIAVGSVVDYPSEADLAHRARMQLESEQAVSWPVIRPAWVVAAATVVAATVVAIAAARTVAVMLLHPATAVATELARQRRPRFLCLEAGWSKTRPGGPTRDESGRLFLRT